MKKIIILSLIVLITACREKYVPQLTNEPVTGYLVVEGFINSGAGATTITLSRTGQLSNQAAFVKESKATVRVENKNNTTSFVLTETAAGVYTYPQLSLSATDQYRLYIKSSSGKEYVSDYSIVRRTPDIDSVSWRRENGGVQIYANTHDNQALTRYYQFKYEETWEFTSKYLTNLKTVKDRAGRIDHVGYRDSINFSYALNLYRCWKTNIPSNILINTTEKLTQDQVSLYPLVYIEPASWKLGILYSINVKEYSMSREGFRFMEALRKNTEQLGSIFDAQPSDNNGNMHCITSPDEVVIGFVEVSEEKQKRIFISNSQVPGWNYLQDCPDQVAFKNEKDSLSGASGIPTTVSEGGQSGLDFVYFASESCVDCTLRGVNTKPSFWP